METNIESTVEGTVIKIAEYGAIVRLQDGKTGLIHISEIADSFVRDIKDFFKEQDRVKVRILNINDKGRYELSTKQVEQPVPEPPQSHHHQQRKRIERVRETVNLGPDESASTHHRPSYSTFDDRLSQFLKDSSDRLFDIKRQMESKQGTRRR